MQPPSGFILILPTKLRRLCFYNCLSVRGGLPECMLGYHPPEQAPPPQQTATVADGTLPTGMHSCIREVFWKIDQTNRFAPPIENPRSTTVTYLYMEIGDITPFPHPSHWRMQGDAWDALTPTTKVFHFHAAFGKKSCQIIVFGPNSGVGAPSGES